MKNKKMSSYHQAVREAREAFTRAKYMEDGGDGPFNLERLLNLAEEYIKTLEFENHFILCTLEEHRVTHWPRIKDLPEEERAPFRQWLSGQTCPLITNLSYEEQDAYYETDYRYWKASLKGKKVPWD